MRIESPKALRRWPFGLLGMLTLLAIVEAFVAGRGLQLSTAPALNARFAATAATGQARDTPVLFLGDSQVKFGVDPRVVGERSELAGYNLAVAGSSPPMAYFLLRRALEHGARPSSIVVGFMTLAGEPNATVSLYAEFASFRDCLDLGSSTKDVGLVARVALERTFASLRYRHAIRAHVLHAIQNESDPNAARSLRRLAEWNDRNGGEMVDASPDRAAHLEGDEGTRLYGTPWQVSSLNAAYFRKIVDLAEDHGVTVYWLVAPVLPEAQALRDSLGLDQSHTRNLRALQSRRPGVVLLDARHAGFTAEEFHDSCHLNRLGARRLSLAVADALAHPPALEGGLARLALKQEPRRK